MGKSETESLRDLLLLSDFVCGYIVHLETRVTEEEGILVLVLVFEPFGFDLGKGGGGGV